MNAPPVLEMTGLSVRHGGVVALDDVTLSVSEGSIVGLIGPNGAGKTTLIDAVSGFTTPRAGRIRFCGRDITMVAPHDRSRLGLSRTFQSLELFDDLTVRENLAVGASTPTFWSTLTDALWRKGDDDPDRDDVLDSLGLSAHADRRPTELSNGERHLVALARAVVSRPRLVLVDEPAAGLDTAETAELGAALAGLPGRGTAVLLVDHDMALVLGVCDIVHVLDFGQLIASGTPAEIRSNPTVISAYLGQHQS